MHQGDMKLAADDLQPDEVSSLVGPIVIEEDVERLGCLKVSGHVGLDRIASALNTLRLLLARLPEYSGTGAVGCRCEDRHGDNESPRQ